MHFKVFCPFRFGANDTTIKIKWFAKQTVSAGFFSHQQQHRLLETGRFGEIHVIAAISIDRLRIALLSSKKEKLLYKSLLNIAWNYFANTISFVISNAFTGVNLIVRPLRQLLSVGWVISSFPSTAKCTFS